MKFRRALSLFLLLIVAIVSIGAIVGCSQAIRESSVVLPGKERIIRDQWVVHTDFALPRRHRLLDELTNLKNTIAYRLDLPTSDEPINVYLFDSADSYHRYMAVNHPNFPNRRAFFLKSDTTLQVYAFWGERIAEDLRHEVAHGYLHAVVTNLPLWFDEGLAEYFEVPLGQHGKNVQHIELLSKLHQTGQWKPDLARLEEMKFAGEMAQVDYAESWLWVHYLLEGGAGLNSFVTRKLHQLRTRGEAKSLAETLVENGITGQNVIEHLMALKDRRVMR